MMCDEINTWNLSTPRRCGSSLTRKWHRECWWNPKAPWLFLWEAHRLCSQRLEAPPRLFCRCAHWESRSCVARTHTLERFCGSSSLWLRRLSGTCTNLEHNFQAQMRCVLHFFSLSNICLHAFRDYRLGNVKLEPRHFHNEAVLSLYWT